MSTSLRIAGVTEALQTLLLPVVQAVTADAQVRIGRPRADDGGVLWQGLNVYLFHVARNTNAGALDLATRDSRGTLMQRPRMAVDLHYLFSFFGDAEKQVPEQMMGRVLTALHAEPTLTGPMLDALVAHDPTGFVARSELVEQADRVTFEILQMSLEDLTRVWGMFQLPYTLTVPIVASMVLLEAELTPQPAPPVKLVRLAVLPGPAPALGDSPPPAQVGEVLAVPVTGLELAGAIFDFGGVRAAADRVTAREARLLLKAEHLTAMHPGAATLTLLTGESMLVGEIGVTIRPWIAGGSTRRVRPAGGNRPVPRGGPIELTVDVSPPPAAEQTLQVSLTAIADPTSRLGRPPTDPAVMAQSVEVADDGQVNARFEALAAGVYRVDVVVGGVSSAPASAVRRTLSRDMVRIR